ncbi:MAG: response regulator transcription factor [Lachnospiraceae bacterium]|nr:response regulator transcription factor [Lachnospiraceae bacterium]
MMKRILIVEDDEKLNEGICLALRETDPEFLQARTIGAAREILSQMDVQMVLLDIHLPDGNGMDFLKEIRKRSQVPVLIITVNDMEMDIVMGLESGANDYITKPFSLMVLRAWVAVWLRNQEKSRHLQICIDDFDFDFERMIYRVRGQEVELSKTEQKLLRILVENRGATLRRGRLLDYVWNEQTEFVEEHALTVTVKRLRDKLGDTSESFSYIKTVYGMAIHGR